MGLGETDDDARPPVRPATPGPDPQDHPPAADPEPVSDQGTTVRLPDPDDLESTREASVLTDEMDLTGEMDPVDLPDVPPPVDLPRRRRWWLIALAAVLIAAGALVARYAMPKSVPQPGAAPPPAKQAPQVGPTASGEIIPPTGGQPVITLPARPADALAGWAAQVGPAAQVPTVAMAAYGYAQLSLESTKPQCHLNWATLAGIGEVESQNGQKGGAVLSPTGRSIPAILGPALDGNDGRELVRDTDAGAFDGDPNFDHRMGPLGILPAAWKLYAIDADADGILDPYDVDDSALAMARLLCSSGQDLSTFDGWTKAIALQHSGDAYAKSVFDAADSYGQRTRNIG
jgi:membrane-bound lytic murein transglycosylase B